MSKVGLNAAMRCPVCDSPDANGLNQVSHVDAARAFINPDQDRSGFEALSQHIRSLWGQDCCIHRQCLECGFGYADPYVAGDDAFYRLAHDHKAGDYPATKWEYRIAKDLLKSLAAARPPRTLRVLEIGAGDGAFIRQIVPELIAPVNVFCTEYDRYAVASIRQLGVRAALGDLRQMDTNPDAPFDVIFMFQVLEHMDRLSDLFAKLTAWSSPGATLVVAVPNAQRTLFNERHGGLLDMPPNHIGRWSRSAFEVLGQRVGWHVVRCLDEPTHRRESWQYFSYYRYARATQLDGTWSARVRGLRPTRLRRALEIGLVAAFAVRSVPLLPQLFADGMGGSILVHFSKQT